MRKPQYELRDDRGRQRLDATNPQFSDRGVGQKLDILPALLDFIEYRNAALESARP
jgi:hypothetical protein